MANKNELQNHTEQQPLPQPKRQPYYNVQRNVLTHEQYVTQSGYRTPQTNCWTWLRGWCCSCSLLDCLPILRWLPNYKWRIDLIHDLSAGVTVCVLNIPHGIAYSMIAGLPPQSGLYMAVFPVLIYAIFGSSRHISVGTFAIASMMTHNVISVHSVQPQLEESSNLVTNNRSQQHSAEMKLITPVEVATALALTAGIAHLIMCLLHLGVLATLLSEPLVSGFITGCAFHVASSQLKHIFGIQIPSYTGYFRVLLTIKDVGLSLVHANLPSCIMSAVVCVYMIICNEWFKPWLKRFCYFPFPNELIAIVLSTLYARYASVVERYGIMVVGAVPTGLPMPKLPQLELLPKLAVHSLPIVVVSYSTVMSIGLVFAKKFHYQIRGNQELLALGAGNLIASVFMGYPIAASLSRSALQVQTGGRTQLASVVSAILIIMVLLWLSNFFADLPRCVLAAIIIITLKTMFWQIKELCGFAKEGLLEMCTWLLTFLTVIIIDIDIGLYVGICCSLLALWLNGFSISSSFLCSIENVPAVYVNPLHHAQTMPPVLTKIFRYAGPLNFATGQGFRQSLDATLKTQHQRLVDDFDMLVIDLSMVAHMDICGCRTLHELSQELSKLGVRLLLACPNDSVYATLLRAKRLNYGPFDIYPSLHDAVAYAMAAH